MGKRLDKHKRSTQYTLHSNEGSLNLILWKDGASVLFADNDFDANAKALITSTINDKHKKNIMTFEAMKQTKRFGAIEMYITMWTFITSTYRMCIGITAPVESKMGVPFMIW